MRISLFAAALWLQFIGIAHAARAQRSSDTASTVGISTALTGAAADRVRQDQLLGVRETAGYLLRSPSSMRARREDLPTRLQARVLGPDILLIQNSKLPYSYNDGALWAGRGLNASATAGLELRYDWIRLAVAPELTYSANEGYALANPESHPPLPADRSAFSSPFYGGANSIDMPIRFGDAPIRRLGPGQSSLLADAGPMTFGVSTENEWWGPGVRNALLLSNNAPGFPHLVLATRRPLHTRAGDFESRWLVGGLSTSDFFTTNADSLRSISLLGLTWAPAWTPGLTLGAARAVYAHASGWSSIPGATLNVFSNVGQPDAKAPSDTTRSPGRDQLTSLFFRWVFPADRFEVYGEWGRQEFPKSLRDLLSEPNHSQAYVLGLQWLGNESWLHGRPHIQGEFSFLQQSSTYRFRPLGSWYASRAVAAGYTNDGQVLGAAVGPGGSSEWVELGYVAPRWEVGASATRIRWLEDVQARCAYAPELSLYGFNDHDVSFLTGLRGSVSTRFGTIEGAVDPGWRYNVFFPLCGRARYPLPPPRDERNRTLMLRFSPHR